MRSRGDLQGDVDDAGLAVQAAGIGEIPSGVELAGYIGPPADHCNTGRCPGDLIEAYAPFRLTNVRIV